MKEKALNDIFNSWNLTSAPVRPSGSEIENLKRMIQDKAANSSFLLLGLTPELLDTILQVGCKEVVVIEIREFAYLSLIRFAKQDWSKVKFIFDDWRTFKPGLLNRFDFVVGHGSFLLLPYTDQWEVTLQMVYDYMNDDGIAWIRHFLMPQNGFNYTDFKNKILSDFNKTCAGTNQNMSMKDFIFMTTLFRCAIILKSTGVNGIVCQQSMKDETNNLCNELDSIYGLNDHWNIMKKEFEIPTARGYEEMMPQAVPVLADVLKLYTKLGLRAVTYELPNQYLIDTLPIIIANKNCK